MYYKTLINKNCSIFSLLPLLYGIFLGNLYIKGALYKRVQLLMLLYSQIMQFINLLNIKNKVIVYIYIYISFNHSEKSGCITKLSSIKIVQFFAKFLLYVVIFFGNLCIKGALYKGLQLLMLLYSQREQFINLLNMENICQNIPVGYVDGSPEI